MQDVYAQLESAGLIVDGGLDMGRIVRCKTTDDTGAKKSGWYVLHEFRLRNNTEVITGRYGNWKRYGDEALKVEFELPPLSDEERAEFARRQAEQRDQAEAEKHQRAAAAAERAVRIFAKLPDTGASDYLKRKKVRAYGLRFSRGSIVVPVRNVKGDLVGLQFIAADGSKKFLTGTAKRGAFHLIGEILSGSPLAIAEGYATAASIHVATGWPVAVAFDAGNLLPVAQALRGLYPDQQMIICADNDAQTDGNPGVAKGAEAARAIGARLWVPDFEAVQRRAA
jgi:putative DNA primase/helicase